jgi:hypothetical protein
MTALGVLIVVVFLGMFVYGGMRLVPAYFEYYNAAKAVSGLTAADLGGSVSEDSIRASLERRFDVSDVTSIRASDVVISATKTGWLLHMSYTVDVPFLGNLSLRAHFDKSATIQQSGGL